MVSAGWMMVFVYFVSLLGTIGNSLRRLSPTAAPVRRLLRSRKVAATAVCVAGVAAHVETFSLPPTFREVTLKGESLAFHENGDQEPPQPWLIQESCKFYVTPVALFSVRPLYDADLSASEPRPRCRLDKSLPQSASPHPLSFPNVLPRGQASCQWCL